MTGVALVAAIAPFNDWVVSNTYLIGSYLPLGLTLYFLIVVLAINGPLSRWKPEAALSRGELTVALGMMLVGCAAPSSGFMRYVTNGLVGITHLSGENADYRNVLRELNLPHWMFPAFRSEDIAEHANDPVIQDFWGRVFTPGNSFADHWRAVPWRAWARPAIAWGLFAAGMWGAILCGAAIVRKQWVENERLPFPLAGVYRSLIEPPEKGRMVNALLGSPAFWIAAGIVFFIHGLNALAVYHAKLFPTIPIAYDVRAWLSGQAWSYFESEAKFSQITFAVIGLTFFVQSNIAFSLWFFFLALQGAQMLVGVYGSGTEVTPAMLGDQLFGAVIPYALMILWVGRRHFAEVARSMIGRNDPEPARFLGDGAAGWGLALCALFMIGWLIAAGASAIGAAVIVALMLMTFMCIARIVAETGLMLGQLPVPLNRPFIYAATLPPALMTRTTGGSFFFASFFTNLFTRDVRENLAVYATHAMKLADDADVRADGGAPDARDASSGRGFVVCLVAALFLSFVISGASQLYSEYTHAVTLDADQLQPLSNWAAYQAPKMLTMDPSVAYLRGSVPPESHNRLGHFTFGAGMTGLLSVLRLYFAWWPLHPVGFLLASTYVMQKIWASIFLGWLAKVVILRLGGASWFHGARSFFIGLVIGEAAAAAFWLIVSLARVAMGLDYHAIRLFPA